MLRCLLKQKSPFMLPAYTVTTSRMQVMTKYDKHPEAAEADLKRASDAAIKAEEDLDNARERADQAERDADAADAANNPGEVAAALRRHEGIEREIEGLRQDLSSAEAHLQSTVKYWGLS